MYCNENIEFKVKFYKLIDYIAKEITLWLNLFKNTNILLILLN